MNGKIMQFMKGKSFYIALALITAFAAMASFFAITTMLNSFRAQPDTIQYGQEDITWDLGEAPVDTKQPEVAKESTPPSSPPSVSQNTQPAQESPAEPSSILEEPVELQPAQAPSFKSPMTGAVLQTFSGDNLVYNSTMHDWRTHNGMDIKGSINTPVVAPTDATVSVIVQDAQWGTVVELTSGKLTMWLCGVKNPTVKVGASVTQGTQLGVLGEIPCESALETHLHLEFMENGVFVNPASYFA